MKTYIIEEKVPMVQWRTIVIEAESEEAAIEKYLNDSNFDYDYEVDTHEEVLWDDAEILEVREDAQTVDVSEVPEND